MIINRSNTIQQTSGFEKEGILHIRGNELQHSQIVGEIITQ